MTRTPADIRRHLEHLADRVDAASPDAADRLSDLGVAVEGGTSTDAWAASNIFQVIDPDTIAEEVRVRGSSDNLIRMLELARNALVFLPIAVTWLGIWLALEAYEQALDANPALADQSFLYLWQQGFEGRLWLTLGTIALIDGALLSLVFVLTLVVFWRNNQKDQEADLVRGELASALADASLVLTERRTHQQTSLVYHFDRAARELLGEMQQERQRVEQLAARKEKEVGDLSTITRDFIAGTQSMLAAVQSLHQTPLQLGRVIGALAQSFQQFAEQHREQQQEFIRAIHQTSSQLKTVTDSNHTVSAEMQAVAAQLQAADTQLQALALDLRDALHISRELTIQGMQAVSSRRGAAQDADSMQPPFFPAVTYEAADAPEHQIVPPSAPQSFPLLEQHIATLTQGIQDLAQQQQTFLASTQQTATQLRQWNDAQQALGLHMQTMGLHMQTMGGDLRTTVDTLHQAATETAHAASEMARLLPVIVKTHHQLLSALQQQSPTDTEE